MKLYFYMVVSLNQRSRTRDMLFTAPLCFVLLHVTHTYYPGWNPDFNRLDQIHLQEKFLGECTRWKMSFSQWSFTWDGRPWHHASLSLSLSGEKVDPMPLSWHTWQKSNLDNDKKKSTNLVIRHFRAFHSIFLILFLEFGCRQIGAASFGHIMNKQFL